METSSTKATLCFTCNISHRADMLCQEALSLALGHLVSQVGVPGECKACKAPVYFVRHKNGRQAPYTLAGQNHFANCPAAEQFRKVSSKNG